MNEDDLEITFTNLRLNYNSLYKRNGKYHKQDGPVPSYHNNKRRWVDLWFLGGIELTKIYEERI